MSLQGLAWLTGVLNFFKTIWYSFASYMRRRKLRDQKRDEIKEKTKAIIKDGSASDMLNQWEKLDRLKDK